jgi:hypothetical protein
MLRRIRRGCTRRSSRASTTERHNRPPCIHVCGGRASFGTAVLGAVRRYFQCTAWRRVYAAFTSEGRRTVSLRRAMMALPDDAATRHALHGVIAFMDGHVGEQLDAPRVARATGLGRDRVEPVMKALADALVVDCDGNPLEAGCVFAPDSVLSLEVNRFLRTGGGEARLHRSIDRYRGRFGSSI